MSAFQKLSCIRCGVPLVDGAVFCIQCGARQETKGARYRDVSIDRLALYPVKLPLSFRVVMFTANCAIASISLLVLTVGGLFLAAGWLMEARELLTGFGLGIVVWAFWLFLLLFLTAIYLVFVGILTHKILNRILGR